LVNNRAKQIAKRTPLLSKMKIIARTLGSSAASNKRASALLRNEWRVFAIHPLLLAGCCCCEIASELALNGRNEWLCQFPPCESVASWEFISPVLPLEIALRVLFYTHFYWVWMWFAGAVTAGALATWFPKPRSQRDVLRWVSKALNFSTYMMHKKVSMAFFISYVYFCIYTRGKITSLKICASHRLIQRMNFLNKNFITCKHVILFWRNHYEATLNWI